MADEDAELALLRSMQDNEAVDSYYVMDGDSGGASAQPQVTEDSNHLQEVKELPSTALADDSLRASQDIRFPSATHNSSEHQSSLISNHNTALAQQTSTPNSQVESRPSSSASPPKTLTPKPRTMGGFIVDDDDDEGSGSA